MIINLKNISWERENKIILKNINWQVGPGENWVLFGLNGSGKTSLLNVVCAYIYPTRGEAKVLGRKFGKCVLQDIREEIGWVSTSMQEQMYPGETGKEIVLSGRFATIGLSLKARPTKADAEKALALLEKLGCIELADRSYRTFSEGEKKKVVLARALMNNPKLLILDEPCGGLDIISREQVLESIELISRETDSPTLIYVTHSPEEILPLFTKTLLLKKGEVYAQGETRSLFSEEIMSAFLDLRVAVTWSNNRPHLLLQEKRETFGT